MTTDIYILSDKAGDYELAIKLVDLSNDGVIAEVSGTVKVVAAQERAMTVNPATGGQRLKKMEQSPSLPQEQTIFGSCFGQKN